MERKYYNPSGTVEEKGGPMVKYHTACFDGSTQPYGIYVPGSYDPDRKWPLVVSLHGFSTDHVLNLRRVFGLGGKPGEPDVDCKQVFPPFPDVECIVVSPYAFGSVGYGSPGEVEVLDVLNEVKRLYSINDDCVYLTGLSMGGEGTWHMAVRYPHLWAAIVPVCAPLSVFIGPEDVRCFAENLNNLPVFASHGTDDSVVPAEYSREMVKILQDKGIHCEYEEYLGVDHNAWDYTYADARIFDWFLNHKRIEKPSKIVYTTDRLRYNTSYWVEITRIREWSSLARIEVEVLDGNIVRASTENISAFRLNLCDAPLDPTLPVTIECNGEIFLSDLITECHIDIDLAEPLEGDLLKRKGLEGPVFDAFSSKFAIVYGTQTDNEELRDSLRCAGECAAYWSDWADIDIPIFADHEIDDDVISVYNLLLIGDDRTNSLISRVNDKLPVRFSEGGITVRNTELSGELGIIEVYPNPLNMDRYIVLIGSRSPEVLMKAVKSYRDMPDFGVISMRTEISKPQTFEAYGYFNGKWELE
ncbi:MAG: carboxylesterase family protein [Armatimonadota bacterium]